MITALTALLVFLSLALIVTVPVALATPGDWEQSKNTFNRGFQIWVSWGLGYWDKGLAVLDRFPMCQT